MATFDYTGIPFPIAHPLFAKDTVLQKKVKQLNTYVEMNSEYGFVRDVLIEVRKDDYSKQFDSFGVIGAFMPDMLFGYSVFQYAKSFVASQGSSNLINKIDSIFPDERARDMHDLLMAVRDKHYAHRQLNANKNQLMYQRHRPEKNDLRLMSTENRKFIVMYGTLDVEVFQENVEYVLSFLNLSIEKLEASILSNLTDSQSRYLLVTDKQELLHNRREDANDSIRAPFENRESS